MTTVNLPNFPKDQEFEEFIAAYFQAGIYYVERNIINREEDEILELDLVVTDYGQKPPAIKLIELKSGGWGFPDLFKIRGWLEYLHLANVKPIFIVQQNKNHRDFYCQKASDLGITLIIIQDPGDAPAHLLEFISPECIDDEDIESWRFSYWIERNLIKRLKNRKKENREKKCYVALDKYHSEINSGIFFVDNIVERLERLYNSYQDFPHISAKCGRELDGEEFDDDHRTLPNSLFRQTFFDCTFTDIQISTFIEHRARLAILKNAVDLKLYQNVGEASRTEKFIKFLGHQYSSLNFLPTSFTNGLEELSSHSFFHLYPVFWQYFIWLFGGFILKDYEDEEYKLLSAQTGIPVSEIPNALRAYDVLFPVTGGWFLDLEHSNIRVLKMFPVPFMGIGANYRRIKYTKTKKYEELNLSGNHTLNDLMKWNNLAVEVLLSPG